MSATRQRNGRQAPLVARVPAAPEPVEQAEGCQLAAAVLAVQAAAPKLLRNAPGQVQGRTYTYVTLDAMVDAVLPLLVEHELLWRTFPTTDEQGQPALRYRMTHVASGESDEDVMSLLLAQAGPQGQGSGITYARRYSLAAYLNLTVDPDDDGAAAGHTQAPTSQPTSQPSAKAASGTDRPASAAQRKMLYAKAKAASLSTGQFANALKASWGDEAVEWSDEPAAERFLDRGLDRLPARLVDAVIDQIAAASQS